MQVSNVPSPKTNGKSQLSQPVGVGYVGGSLVAVQTATNPVCVILLLVLNETVSVLVLLMKLHGWEIDPQCFENLSSSTQSQEQDEHVSTEKSRKVILILCPSTTSSVQVYTNRNNNNQMYLTIMSINSFYLIRITIFKGIIW